jgi:hypothetical protein
MAHKTKRRLEGDHPMGTKQKSDEKQAKLKEAKRDALPQSNFGLPGERKYPMPDASHATNAKARASQQEEKGNLTPAQKAEIDAKADRVLKSKK